jgi:hypothetical protein
MKLGIIACGAIVRELIAIAKDEGWDFELTAVPAQLHNVPEQIPAAVRAKVDAWAARFDVILVGYADCGTAGALDAALDGVPNVVRIPGPHCYEFFGGPAFDAHNDAHPGTFYLTDFLARHFDSLVWKGLGLARHPELLPLYFGNYTHVLYLNQLRAHDEDARARAAAEKLGVTYARMDTELNELRTRVIPLVQACAARTVQPARTPTCVG